MAIESLERGKRTPRVAILAVVIILDDQRAGGASPLEQREPPRQAHVDAKRKLMPRRDIDETKVAVSRVRHFHPLVVDAYADELRAMRLEPVGGSDVARRLHADAIPG